LWETKSPGVSLLQQVSNNNDGMTMRVFKVDGSGEQQQLISDELRQLKLMSKDLRTKSLRMLMERKAGQRLDAKPKRVSPPAAKASPPAAAA
jgi:hypothetical protein